MCPPNAGDRGLVICSLTTLRMITHPAHVCDRQQDSPYPGQVASLGAITCGASYALLPEPGPGKDPARPGFVQA